MVADPHVHKNVDIFVGVTATAKFRQGCRDAKFFVQLSGRSLVKIFPRFDHPTCREVPPERPEIFVSCSLLKKETSPVFLHNDDGGASVKQPFGAHTRSWSRPNDRVVFVNEVNESVCWVTLIGCGMNGHGLVRAPSGTVVRCSLNLSFVPRCRVVASIACMTFGLIPMRSCDGLVTSGWSTRSGREASQ